MDLALSLALAVLISTVVCGRDRAIREPKEVLRLSFKGIQLMQHELADRVRSRAAGFVEASTPVFDNVEVFATL